jgi:hypothetical protein
VRSPTTIRTMDKPLITAAEMDEMTPNERAAAFDDRVITSWDDVPPSLRAKIAEAPLPAHLAET